MDLANDTTTLDDKKAIASKVVGSVENRETERLISANAVTVVKNENNVLPLKLIYPFLPLCILHLLDA